MMTFQDDSRVTPDPATFQVGARLVHPRALVTTIPGPLKQILEILRPRMGVLSLRRESIGSLEMGRQIMLRSLVAPHKGTGGFGD